jgi:hypothetical protein
MSICRSPTRDIQNKEMGRKTTNLQQAIINLKPNAPLSDHRLHHSMHKTFTDCYYAPGFVGGGWEVAVNTNQSDGVRLDASKMVHQVGLENRRLACYYLGWESIEVCQGIACVIYKTLTVYSITIRTLLRSFLPRKLISWLLGAAKEQGHGTLHLRNIRED